MYGSKLKSHEATRTYCEAPPSSNHRSPSSMAFRCLRFSSRHLKMKYGDARGRHSGFRAFSFFFRCCCCIICPCRSSISFTESSAFCSWSAMLFSWRSSISFTESSVCWWSAMFSCCCIGCCCICWVASISPV